MSQNIFGKIFTKSRLTKAGLLILLVCIIAGGAEYYYHQQKIAEHAQLTQARTAMLEAQADKNNLALLDEATIRSIAAQTICVDEAAVTFKEIELSDKPHQHDDKGHKKDKHQVPAPQDYAALSSAQATASAPVFQPVYKVSCRANNLKYNLSIDAVTGDVLYSNIKD